MKDGCPKHFISILILAGFDTFLLAGDFIIDV